MKNSFRVILPIFSILLSCTNSERTAFHEEPVPVVITPAPDTLSLIRNPCMGWGLYDDACNEVQEADLYWQKQDEAARKYASFFYVRWRWSDMEPEEGKYAWLHNENYQKLIQGALDRGLKLAFRIYDNGQDNIHPGTPDFVREAGAEGYIADGMWGSKHWTPYVDDPVFQEKLANFVRAFAQEYNDPERVIFVDGYNMGWWGECHHIQLSGRQTLPEVFDWITTLYSSNFTQVIPVLPFGSEIGYETEKTMAIDTKGYAMRRDGLGSMWFSGREQEIVQERYGESLLIGESCWWGGYQNDWRPWESDTQYDLNSWRDVYELTCRHALEGHFNTLDLREIPETTGWTTLAEDKVWEFIRKGGYRFIPLSIVFPDTIKQGAQFTLKHSWRNYATGYLPNNNPKWNGKYKVAFAWLNDADEVCALHIDTQSDPGVWLKGRDYLCECTLSLPDLSEGNYRLAIAIVDVTRQASPAIHLATTLPETTAGWTPLSSFCVQRK